MPRGERICCFRESCQQLSLASRLLAQLPTPPRSSRDCDELTTLIKTSAARSLVFRKTERKKKTNGKLLAVFLYRPFPGWVQHRQHQKTMFSVSIKTAGKTFLAERTIYTLNSSELYSEASCTLVLVHVLLWMACQGKKKNPQEEDMDASSDCREASCGTSQNQGRTFCVVDNT